VNSKASRKALRRKEKRRDNAEDGVCVMCCVAQPPTKFILLINRLKEDISSTAIWAQIRRNEQPDAVKIRKAAPKAAFLAR
jgi:hypothetical protein